MHKKTVIIKDQIREMTISERKKIALHHFIRLLYCKSNHTPVTIENCHKKSVATANIYTTFIVKFHLSATHR